MIIGFIKKKKKCISQEYTETIACKGLNTIQYDINKSKSSKIRREEGEKKTKETRLLSLRHPNNIKTSKSNKYTATHIHYTLPHKYTATHKKRQEKTKKK
jgi:hypothetical protein